MNWREEYWQFHAELEEERERRHRRSVRKRRLLTATMHVALTVALMSLCLIFLWLVGAAAAAWGVRF